MIATLEQAPLTTKSIISSTAISHTPITLGRVTAKHRSNYSKTVTVAKNGFQQRAMR